MQLRKESQLPVGLLAQLARALHRRGIAEVRVGILASLKFFRLSFRSCISCDFNCDDLIYIYFFISWFKYM